MAPGIQSGLLQPLQKESVFPNIKLGFQCLPRCLRGSFYNPELVALRWSDVDWLNGKLRIERGIVHQVVDDVKTAESNREMHIDAVILQGLKDWKQLTQFSGPDDWMFASPSQIGRLPISYSGIWQALRTAAAKAGIGHISSHTFRHTHR